MIRAHSLTKRFTTGKGQSKNAVDGIDFVVEPGRVTGFLGPNGAGKSTTMRMILGLDAPTSGTVSVNGHRYAASPAPLREIGALLDAHAIHPGRSARDHLRWMAASNGIPTTRVGEVLELVGLEPVAGQRAGRFSLGMGQRLGIAAAMLGDPPVVVLDEPVNGLDPEGIRWVRTFARQLADEGRTVFISSHLMSEMALMADHLLVIGRGRILADCSMTEFMSDHAASYVRVKAPALADAAAVLGGRGLEVSRHDDEIRVVGLDAPSVGELLFEHRLAVHELTLVRSSLEDAFMGLTADSVEYHAIAPSEGVAR
ncbi:ATP-binding cassette domain-containing protein [Nocardioides sp. LMS-CY]|uniref:ABC-2 type transport system ATP-binding protein n=1 Tax=Nocardioides soli TaxID=1036020 RepID=A0A7W4VVU2_9ACTN|nr:MULTISPECIES: ATP-binding cassette domain-containing protein [Nocardioides]MBB3042448.1 ABC-2 type transport system ATP-binding protein [Nocardioides soli]QWF22594.1 ATP-binding cassette domain-containing protein [Nocardioides sp. LMS-CY]